MRLRTSDIGIVSIPAGESLSEAFEFRPFSGLSVRIPEGWDTADLGFLAAPTRDGEYLPLRDKLNAFVFLDAPTAGSQFSAPAEVFAEHWLKLKSQDAAGAAVNQSDGVVLTLILKS